MAEILHFDLDAEEMEVFCLEAEEMIGHLDASVLAIEQGQSVPASIQVLFRAAHTLKGSAGAIGHHRMANLTHAMENALDLVRQSRLTVTQELIDLMLQAVDVLRVLNQEVRNGESGGLEPTELIAKFQAIVTTTNGIAGAQVGAKPALAADLSAPIADPADATTEHAKELLRVIAQISADSIAPAARALQILLTLEICGNVVWSNPGREIIELGETLQQVEVLVDTEWAPARIREQLSYIGDLANLEVLAPARPEHEPEIAEPAANKGAATTSAAPAGNKIKTVRTSVERLDKLMNLVGELVTDRNRLLRAHTLLSTHFRENEFVGELAQGIAHLASITDELQEEVMRARMLPLENAFGKFPRIVRDLARDAGKDIVLEMQGQETELDRTVIEEISDPLLHLLRNAVDHGIESQEERRSAGKPEHGTIRLAGRSEGNHIIITVSDDGRGIDSGRVRRTAVERNFITEEVAAHLSEAEAYELVFLPGLSTARKVTDISGRGVGMDVVRSNIEKLHGSVAVKSRVGIGTTFELSLPLTLAIMPVLLVGLCSQTYCIPLTAVTEVLEVDPDTIHAVERGEVIAWRERLLPLVRLRSFFGLNGAASKNGQRYPTVAVRWGEEHVGLIVDRLVGQQEIVIKGLGPMIGQVMGLSGSAILGDGTVALIVDVPGLIKRASRLNAGLSVGAFQ